MLFHQLFRQQKRLNLVFIFISIFFSSLSAQTSATEWFFRGKDYRDAGDFENALRCFDNAIALNAAFAGAYNNRGTVKAAMNRHEEAIIDLRKSSELGVPLTSVNYYNLGFSLEQLGRCSEAIEAYLHCKEEIGLKIESFDVDINAAIARVLVICRA